MAGEDSSPNLIEDVVSELHRRGVERGEQEYERLIAEARAEANSVLEKAKAERDQLIAQGRREAERLVASAQSESEQLLEAFLAALPEMFSRRAREFLEHLLDESFAPEHDDSTVLALMERLQSGQAEAVAEFLRSAGSRSFVESLLVFATIHFAGSDGFVRFEIDAGLRSRLASILADPRLAQGLPFEFRDGIRGFSVVGHRGREVEVSPESFRHMAHAWASEQFREVFARLLAKAEANGEPRRG